MKFHTVIDNPKHLQVVKEIWLEYANSLDYHLSSIPTEMATFPEPYRSTGGLFLVEFDGRFIGSAGLKLKDEDTLELKRFYIRPAYRRKGVGTAFIRYIIGEAKLLEKARIQLSTVLPNMKTAYKLYQSVGFYEVDTYFNAKINKKVAVMQYDLI